MLSLTEMHIHANAKNVRDNAQKMMNYIHLYKGKVLEEKLLQLLNTMRLDLYLIEEILGPIQD